MRIVKCIHYSKKKTLFIFSRFVNYVNEVCQPGIGLRQMSIANAVQTMGLPRWVVDIRHEATHGQMPPMEMLRKAVDVCHRWLWVRP
jgi:ribosomal biogenesis protein LAS1